MRRYQFALLRYVHNSASAEFVNVGAVMWLADDRRLLHRVNDRYGRLSAFFQEFDGAGYRQMIRQLDARFRHASDELSGAVQPSLFGPQPPDKLEEILERLVGDDASCFQYSSIMAGIAPDPDARFAHIFAEFIERHESPGPRQRRDEMEIWTGVETRLRDRKLTPRLQSGVEVRGPHYSYRFRTGWMNGKVQVLEPISFDYLNGVELIEKANTWSGRMLNLSRGTVEFQLTAVVALPQRGDLQAAYEQARVILSEAPCVRQVVPEQEMDRVLADIEGDLRDRQG